MNRPQAEEYAEYYKKYIDTVNDQVILELEHQRNVFPNFIRSLTTDQGCHSYSEGKWTIKELLGHVIDTERIMAYRMLRIARNDETPLAGFEENDYVKNARFAERTLDSLADEFEAVRISNMFLINSLNESDFDRKGTASGYPVTVRALIFILAGHVNHHKNIITERYL